MSGGREAPCPIDTPSSPTSPPPPTQSPAKSIGLPTHNPPPKDPQVWAAHPEATPRIEWREARTCPIDTPSISNQPRAPSHPEAPRGISSARLPIHALLHPGTIGTALNLPTPIHFSHPVVPHPSASIKTPPSYPKHPSTVLRTISVMSATYQLRHIH